MTDQEKKFVLLDPALDWRILQKEALYSDDRGLSVQKVPGEDKPLKDELGNFGGLDYPSGLAVDTDNNVYIADTSQHLIKKYDFCTSQFSTLACLGGHGRLPRQLDSPQGLAISPRNDLYIADTGNHRIQVFSLKGLVLRHILGYTDADRTHFGGSGDGQFNSPTDIALDSRGNIYVADRGNQRIQCFSRDGRFLRKFGEKGDGEGEFRSPTHIAIDRQDRIYVIDDTKDYVQVFDSQGEFLAKVAGVRGVAGSFRPLAIAIDNEGNVYISERGSGRIYQYSFEAGIKRGPSYIGHSASYDSEISYLILDNAGNLYAALKDRGMVTRMESEKPRYEKKGCFITEAIDSEIYQCRWNRIVTETDIPEGTSIEIYTYTSNEPRNIKELEPLTDRDWSGVHINTDDSLVMSPPGRYLWLRAVLRSNIQDTPLLKNLKVYYPRITYLQYLPKVYQEDESSRDFLERLLSIFETVLSGFEDEITNIASYFSAEATPADFLPWLAAWLGLVLDENWPEEKRRKLIRLAPELYKKRGTPEGLKSYIELYTGLNSHLHIIEHYNLRRWLFLGESTLGSSSAIWSKGFVNRLQLDEYSTINNFRLVSSGDPVMDPFHHYAHRFSVIVPSSFCDSESKEHAIKRIVEVEKPAHTEYSVCKVEPKFRVGIQSTIGVDTIIGTYPVTVLGVKSTVGIDSILGASPERKGPPILEIGKSSRIGVDTLIN